MPTFIGISVLCRTGTTRLLFDLVHYFIDLKNVLTGDLKMEYSEFVSLWKNGQLDVDVNQSMALQVANSKILPMNYRAAHIFWSWVWILSIPASFVVMYFYTWWAGLLSLFFLTPILSKSTKRSSQQFMIDYSLENEEFYKYACSEGIILVRVK